ncbi:MAG: TMEM175 family protein [Rudaea sp.]|uniref:TMEM175 family protein n=1 Tax=Rudaea sp. TaxID=2136325 RepID=UPI0039E2E5AF
MEKNRLEAFTDGVIAVIITIMVLELKPPHEATFAALLDNWPVFLSYVLSFVYVGIYWNNHHHLMHAVEKIDGKVMWANLFLLFWLSLIPFTTAWLNEAHGEVGREFPAAAPAAAYGFVLLMAAIAWIPLSRSLIACNGGMNSRLAQALGGDAGDWKAKVSPALYVAGIASALSALIVDSAAKAFWMPKASCLLYAVVAALWLIPDRRIEKHLSENP